MSQKGSIAILPVLIMIVGVVVGVYFIERNTGFISKALDSLPGPSRSGTIKIPVRSPMPSKIATSSASPATASASVKPSSTATPSASPAK